MEELVYTMWLSLACTPGSETFIKLLNKFGTPRNIYDADADVLASCISSKTREYDSLSDKSLSRAEEVLEFCHTKNVGILTYFDGDFPNALKKIKNPPVLLYYRGRLPDFNGSTFISVVGTRNITDYGRKNTFKLAYELAVSGAVVVSGMAIGVDGVALAGALAAAKPTVAIIGSGIDVCYPAQHKRLAREIVKGGCVMTEYAPGTRPERYNFPTRNRIISGLSEATVVMEGRSKSGSVITARHAGEQGRDVYAFPGSVGNANSEATNLLIKNGARLFISADDIIRDFEKKIPGRLDPFKLKNILLPDMNAVLHAFEVSCVAAGDDVFIPTRTKKKTEVRKTVESIIDTAVNAENEERAATSLDKSTFALYKKIPVDSDISVESLVDSSHGLREVMQGLLNLEITGFITMLPGDRVKRKL